MRKWQMRAPLQNKNPAGYRGNLAGLVNKSLIWFIRSFRSGLAISSIVH